MTTLRTWMASSLRVCLLLSSFCSHAAGQAASSVLSLDGNQWQLATDPQNVGREQKWFDSARPEAKTTKVPSIIQETFPAYHGVAWYWRDFDAPTNPHPQGRTLLRFWAVDYTAEVWLNGVKMGKHEGGEGVFILDVTEAIKPGAKNILAVRVLNPTNELIDGICLPVTPRRCKVIPFTAGALYNDGGIGDSVELLLAPATRIADLQVIPDPKTGTIHIQTIAKNSSSKTARGHWEFVVAPAASGETLQTVKLDRELPPGDSLIEAGLQVNQPRLWELNDPNLYRVTARVRLEGSDSVDEQSTRCGFRAFRFENGYYRLNGKRVFLKCALTIGYYPIGLHWPHDPDLARRDLLLTKAMGFNSIRFIAGVPTRYQLDLCDALGLMVYEENFAAWYLSDSPRMKERFDRGNQEMITRDRNHPCIVMWGLLNETGDGSVFRHAVETLPYVRTLDDTRIVMLNSGMVQFVSNGGVLKGLSKWSGEVGFEPNVTHNGTAGLIQGLGNTWIPSRLALHPGPKGEYCVLRWTAPTAAEYSLSAKFIGMSVIETTESSHVHVLHQGQSLFDGVVNLYGQSACEKTVSVKAGDTVDFAVGSGNGQYGGEVTGIVATICAGTDKTFDAVRDFSKEKNPQGVWSYGYLQPGKSPDTSTFKPFAEEETIGPPKTPFGVVSNPGSNVWEDVLCDTHPYQRVPHTAGIIHELRSMNEGSKPVFISEYGIGGGVDLAKVTRHFEQLGAEKLEDAQWYQQRLDQFLVDWKRWNLADTFANPEDFFAQSLAKVGRQRLLGLNAIRANPNVVAHCMTSAVDVVNGGEGLLTTFRDLKPGTVDCVFDGWYPLRWCLFVEPANVYRKTPVKLEAVLVNEDMLKPGEYPARLQVVGPDAKCVFDRTIRVAIPDLRDKPEPPMAIPVFAEDVAIDGPPGKYRFLATFEQGAAAMGGETEFYVADPAELPKVETEVVLWGDDPELAGWLKAHGICTRPFSSLPQAGEEPGVKGREVILASSNPPSPGGAPVFRDLAQRIARGSSVVFLCSSVFAKGDEPIGWVPLVKKGSRPGLPAWLYHKDEWTKNHPVFEGLPAGGLMDYTFYREIISDAAWVGQDAPAEVVAGATNTSIDYSAGLTVSVNSLGAGRFILNTLLIRENLGRSPVADRLLINMLRHAARDAAKPPADLPADFDAQLKSLGY
jgi:hypothetical protein